MHCATVSVSPSRCALTKPTETCWHQNAGRDWPRSGAQPQRLLWASTGTKDPTAPDMLYIEALAAPDTINTMPEKTLLAFADHGKPIPTPAMDGGNAEAVLADFVKAGIDAASLAAALQRDGTAAFADSWNDLMRCIVSKSAMLAKAGQQ